MADVRALIKQKLNAPRVVWNPVTRGSGFCTVKDIKEFASSLEAEEVPDNAIVLYKGPQGLSGQYLTVEWDRHGSGTAEEEQAVNETK